MRGCPSPETWLKTAFVLLFCSIVINFWAQTTCSAPTRLKKIREEAYAMPAADPKIVEKIPFFRHLSAGQIKQLLQAGQMHTKDAGDMLCQRDDKSTEIFLLLSGELVVKDGDAELARVKPVDIVGEMGVVTSQPRSATIEVWQSSALLSISKIRFDAILKNDVDMSSKIYRNMLESLSQKLRDTNTQLAQSQSADDGDHIMASVV